MGTHFFYHYFLCISHLTPNRGLYSIYLGDDVVKENSFLFFCAVVCKGCKRYGLFCLILGDLFIIIP